MFFILLFVFGKISLENLQKSNIAMRQQFSLVNSWHTNVMTIKETHENEIKEFKKVNDEVIIL